MNNNMIITIFIVDDYLLSRVAYKRYFSSYPEFKVIQDFSNAVECIKNLKKYQPDVIIMNIDLPKINGIQATKLISQKYPKTKIIIITSDRDEQKILASLACGACGYIVKNEDENNNNSIDFKKIINIIMEGNLYLSLKTAHFAFSCLPNPNEKDIDNLYEYKNIRTLLTKRELEVLKLLIEGKTNAQIAKEIIVSTNTIKAHVGKIFEKMNVNDRVQAAVKAVRAGLF